LALSAIKNQQILDAALAEFLAHGFHGARMDAIAERANVSKRTVYKHFDGKDALFTHMVTVMRAGFRDAATLPYDPAKPVAEQLRHIAVAEGALYTSKPFMKLVRLLVSEASRDRSLAALFPSEEPDGGALAHFLSEADRDDTLRVPDPALAANQFKDLLKGRSFWPAVIGQAVVSNADMAKIIEQALEVFLVRYLPATNAELRLSTLKIPPKGYHNANH
jgi:TetR/AcrR family transcriptional regulator, regulator of autoinduction and epiphytic fitness